MIKISYSTTTDESAEKIFDFFRTIKEHYPYLSRGHETFEFLDGDFLVQGRRIHNEERVSGQRVIHEYHVTDFIKNRYIKLVSHPSIVTILKVLKFYPKVTVKFEIIPFEKRKNCISSQITLEFRRKTAEFLARMLNTEHIWESHLKEEMENAVKIIKAT